MKKTSTTIIPLSFVFLTCCLTGCGQEAAAPPSAEKTPTDHSIPTPPAAAPASSELTLEQLAQELNGGGEGFEFASKALIGIGTFDSIRTLILGISKMTPSRETLGAIYSLHDFPDRQIAEWIAKILPEMPVDQAQIEHINLLCAVGGAKATPEALLRIGQSAHKNQSSVGKGLQLVLISEASAPDTTQALIQLTQTNDLSSDYRSSVDFAAATALGLQGSPEGVSYMLQQIAKENNPTRKALYAEALTKIDKAQCVPLLISVAQGQNSALGDTTTRGLAISILSNMGDENAWHALRKLKNDSNGAISYLADKALRKVHARTGFEYDAVQAEGGGRLDTQPKEKEPRVDPEMRAQAFAQAIKTAKIRTALVNPNLKGGKVQFEEIQPFLILNGTKIRTLEDMERAGKIKILSLGTYPTNLEYPENDDLRYTLDL